MLLKHLNQMSGVNKLAGLIGVSLGLKGRNVVLESEYGSPKIVNNGVTVAKEVQLSVMPIRSVIGAAKAIVNGACRGDSYLTEPGYIRTTFYWKVFCPEVLEIMNRWLLISGSSERGAISKKLLDLTGLKNYLYPESIRNPKLKPN